uniref:Mitochondrial import inner membrane translocase subunit TIM50 n=1 Tax=Leersia perrieri TaxID=77586 RepID=A0A0D9WJT4_9ORYZ
MSALMMNNCNNDGAKDELYECCNLDNTIQSQNVHSQINELELSQTREFNQCEQPAGFCLSHGDTQNDPYLRTQAASQDIKIGQGAEFMDDRTFTVLKGLITKGRTSSPYFEGGHKLNLLNHVNEDDGDGIPVATNPTLVLSQSCDPLDHVPINVDTSAGVLTNNPNVNDSMLIDELGVVSGRYGVLPSIEKTEGNIAIDEANSFGATATMCCDNGHLSHYIHQNLTGPLPNSTDLTSMYPTSNLPAPQTPRKNVTLVLGLDETLIHSSPVHCDGADFTIRMYHGTKEHTVYVKKRPHVDAFLQKVADMFKAVIFTASAFRLQEENGIPIKSWINDPADRSLFELIPFLEDLAVADDVRPIIAKMLGSPRSIT